MFWPLVVLIYALASLCYAVQEKRPLWAVAWALIALVCLVVLLPFAHLRA